MLTNSQKKYIKSLHQKKYRQKYNKFIVESPKHTLELLLSQNYKVDSVYALESWIIDNKELLKAQEIPHFTVNNIQLASISNLRTPNNVFAVVEASSKLMPNSINPNDMENMSWVYYLDGIKDPGNLGTIVRLADWFGIDAVICSRKCVEILSPKVVQSTMGSLFKVKMVRQDFDENWLNVLPVYSLDLHGKSIYKTSADKGIIVVGSESHGVSDHINAIKSLQKLTIPGKGTAESLNAAIACGIATSHLMVNKY